MYELRRSVKIIEQLKLGDEVLDIVIAPEEIVRDYRVAMASITEAQKAVRKAQQNKDLDSIKAALEQFGDAITGLMTVLLGKENTEKILAFYEGNRIEMSSWITPYLIGVIKPKIDQATTEMQRQARKAYRKAARRRIFGK
ncbi:MAG: hypothetical protein GXW96_12745 [Christensenellaceae bacterium]|nr:hypothetical protein [Christensenellaceae bacterium]